MTPTPTGQVEPMIKVSKSPATFYRICIEGNIGCGKTSILKYISAQHGFTDHQMETWTPKVAANSDVNLIISPEPINRWTSVGKEKTNLLSSMYSDPQRYGYAFEHYSQFTRCEQMRTVYEAHLKDHEAFGRKTMHLLERSIFSNRFCFVENFYTSGKIQQVEYHILDQWFEHLMAKPEAQINKFLYLRTSPQTVYERMQKRARSEEDTIPLDYLTEIHQHHERLFDRLDQACWRYLQPPLAKVVVIDANQPFEDVCRQVDKHITSTII